MAGDHLHLVAETIQLAERGVDVREQNRIRRCPELRHRKRLMIPANGPEYLWSVRTLPFPWRSDSRLEMSLPVRPRHTRSFLENA